MIDDLDDSQGRTRLSLVAGLAGLLIATLIQVSHQMTWGLCPLPDTYTALRVSLHAVAGDGFVFNPGETAAPFSSPLYTLVLTGAQSFGASVTDAAALLSLGGMWLAAVFIVFAGGTFLWRLTATFGITALLWMPPVIQLSLSGSELPLFGALVCGAMTFFVRGRFALAGLLLGLGVLVRLEFLFPLVIGAISAAIVLRKRGISFIVLALVPVIAWATYAQTQYGAVLLSDFVWPRSSRSLFVAWKAHASVLVDGRSQQITWILAGTGLLIEMAQRSRAAMAGLFGGLLFIGFGFVREGDLGVTTLEAWRNLALLPFAFFFVGRLIHWMALSIAGRRWGVAIVLIAGSVPIVFSVEANLRQRDSLNAMSERVASRDAALQELAREIEQKDSQGQLCVGVFRPSSLYLELRRHAIERIPLATDENHADEKKALSKCGFPRGR